MKGKQDRIFRRKGRAGEKEREDKKSGTLNRAINTFFSHYRV